MTGPVSLSGQRIMEQYQLGKLRQDLLQAQTQVNTGKKGTFFSDLDPGQASFSINYRQAQNVLQSYGSALNIVRGRTSSMDAAMNDITESARYMMGQLMSQLQGDDPPVELLRSQASTALQQVLQKLNLKVGDRYVFAGSDITNSPLANAANLASNMQGVATTLMAGTPTRDDVINAANGLSGTALGYSTGVLTAEPVTVRGDDGLDLDYTVLANQSGFADIIRGLSLIANTPAPTNAAETDSYWSIVNGASGLLERGAKDVDRYQSVLGATTKQIDELLSQHDETDGQLAQLIGNVEDADLAEAVTKLQSLQVQLQASYQVTAQMRDLSLINYL